MGFQPVRSSRFRGVLIRLLVFWLGVASLTLGQTSAAQNLRFRDISRESGLTTVPHSSDDKRYLVEMMGGGVGLFDCDNDGKLDIIVVGDSTVDRFLHGGDLMVTLYRQDGNLHFTDITSSAGLTTRGWGMGVAIADFDNDGLPDIYVTGYGHNVLYHNLGGCKFQDVTEQAHVAGGGFSVGAAWADYDHDGRLDLFVSRYVHTDIHKLPHRGELTFDYKGLPLEVPRGEGETFLLFHNRGDGTFEEVSEKAGVANLEKRRGMGVTWADYDHDGWPDLFVANDMGPNYLFHNRHDGTFEDVGVVSGVAVDPSGLDMGNMAGDFGDFDRDGYFDLVVSRFGGQPVGFYRNQQDKGFFDIAWDTKLHQLSGSPVKWGVGFADFGNDGWPDVLVANGNIAPKVAEIPDEPPYREKLQLFRNTDGRTFKEVADISHLNDGALQSRRGLAFGDLNNDGKIDVVVYNVGGPPSLFINESATQNHRVIFRLIGRQSNRDAVGARVTVHTSGMQQIDEVKAGGGYLSSSDQRIHFGLGSDSVMKEVEIEWPGGTKDKLQNVAGDAIYTIVEGVGIENTVKLPLPNQDLKKAAPVKQIPKAR